VSYEQVAFVFQWQVSHFITVTIGIAVAVGVGVCYILKVEPLPQHLFPVDPGGLFLAEQGFQYPAVLRKHAIDVADRRAVHVPHGVVVHIATVVVTEFFVNTAMKLFVAGEAVPG
jgi:hypothetical protein